jgi:hypothetical protein
VAGAAGGAAGGGAATGAGGRLEAPASDAPASDASGIDELCKSAPGVCGRCGICGFCAVSWAFRVQFAHFAHKNASHVLWPSEVVAPLVFFLFFFCSRMSVSWLMCYPSVCSEEITLL